MFDGLVDCVSDVASTIADFLGFSVPEKGPLHKWAYNNPGSDMLELYSEGIEDGMNDFEVTLYNTAATINKDISGLDMNGNIMVNRTSDMSEAVSSFEQFFSGHANGTIVIPVYIGGEQLDTLVVDALDRANYLSGGH